MAYSFVSVKKAGNNAGRPSGKAGYLLVVRESDVEVFTRAKDASRVSAFSLKTGAKPIGVFLTNTTQNVYHQQAGEADSRGYIHHADGEHPGDSEQFNDFIENNTNVGLIVFQVSPDDLDCKVAGLPGNPVFLTQDNGQDNKDAKKHALQFVQEFQGPVLGRMAKSFLPATDDAEVNAILGLPSGSDGGGI